MDALERRSICGAPLPAFSHQVIHFMRTSWWSFHSVSRLKTMKHIGQIDARIRWHSISCNLPQKYTERPNIRLCAEFIIRETFWSRPLDRELGASVCCVSIVTHQSSETEVSNLYEIIIGNETISSRQISMNKVSLLEIAHSRCNLCRHVKQSDSIKCLTTSCPKEVQQVAMTHEFSDDVEWRLSRAHANQLHKIRMFHFLHDGGFFEEVFQCHRVLFESFNCDNVAISLPDCFVDFSILTTTQLVLHHNVSSTDFPFVGFLQSQLWWWNENRLQKDFLDLPDSTGTPSACSVSVLDKAVALSVHGLRGAHCGDAPVRQAC